MKKYLLYIASSIVAAGLLSVLPLSAQVAGSDEVIQSEGMAFSRISHDPVSVGKAFAGRASVSSIAFSSFSNPAAAPFFSGEFDAKAGYQLWGPSSSHLSTINAGIGYNLGMVGLTVGLSHMTGSAYDIVDGTGMTSGSFTPKDLAVNVGFGVKAMDQLSIGASVRYLSEKIADDLEFTAISFDLMAMGRFPFDDGSTFSVVGGLANMGTPIKDEAGATFPLPSSLALAGEYSLPVAEDMALSFDIDGDYFLKSGGITAAVAAEFSYADLLFLRGGYHYGTSASVLPSFAAVGLGVKYMGVTFDFGFMLANEFLSNSLCLSLGYRF